MIVYFDMDGVLTDLDGFLAEKAGVSRSALKSPTFRALRSHWITKSITADQVAHWRDIPPNRPREFRKLFSWLRVRDIKTEILTSYGLSTMADRGVTAHAGKVKWLSTHYLAELENQTISRFNGVQNCWQKEHYATPDSLLIDDQEENVNQWRAAGGQAVLYDLEDHDAGIKEFKRLVQEMT